MSGFIHRMLMAGFLALALMLPGASGWAMQPQPTLPQSDLVIHTAQGPKRFRVELANTDEQRARGLMYRSQMAPDAGMLFDFMREQRVSFWMRNTPLPLDLLFIRADGTILNIHQRAIPFDESGLESAGPVRAVLEVNGGTAARLGVKPGDRVDHKIFGRNP